MQLDYHYYVIFQLARLAGFSIGDATTIAYASQYVDDSTESEPVKARGDQQFDTVRTAHYSLGAFDWDVQKKIYMPFHFLPRTIRWQSPSSFSYVTCPASLKESELPAMLVRDALSEEEPTFRLVRLGVALHTVADTFAHWGFSGRHHGENNVGRIWHEKRGGGWRLQVLQSFVADIFVPQIGHVEAGSDPDEPYLRWRYTNDSGRRRTRDNLRSSSEGVKVIYAFLRRARAPGCSADLESEHAGEFAEIRRLLRSRGGKSERCERWRRHTGARGYEKTEWRKEALRGNVKWDDMSPEGFRHHSRSLEVRSGFDKSRWACFHRAAFKQRSLVVGWLN